MRIGRPLLVFPLLLATYPILNLYATNVDRLRLSEALAPLGSALAGTLVFSLALGLILKDKFKAGLLASVIVILFFSYGHVYEALTSKIEVETKIGFVSDWHVFLLSLWCILFLLAIYFVVKRGSSLRPAISYFNVTTAVLVALPLLNIGQYTISRETLGSSTVGDASESIPQSGPLPDIYYIILDGYTDGSVLEDYYRYDNSEFLDYLTDRGFYVVTEGHSNYGQTFLSLASSLNMQLLDHMSDEVGVASRDRAIPYRMIQDSEVVHILKSRGYTFVNFSSSWGPTDHNPLADINYEQRSLNEFRTVLLETTLLRPFSQGYVAADRQSKILYNFEQLAKVPDQVESPKFVFAHFLVPHPPYVFDRSGPVGPDGNSSYLEQLTFVNNMTMEMIDEILARSETPPIIILQGDHGPKGTDVDHALEVLSEGHEMDLSTAVTVRSTLSILNAYYLPGDGQDQLYSTITPVNSFRLIFDTYLGTDLGLLEDRSYFSGYHSPYEFHEVQPSGHSSCEGLADGYDQIKQILLEWQQAHGQPASLILNTSPAAAAYSSQDLSASRPWTDERGLHRYVVTWAMNGDALFFVDELPAAPIPDAPFGATLETVEEVPVQCDDSESVLRVRHMVDLGPEIRRSIYEQIFPSPNDNAEQYRAIALHLIDTEADGAVVAYPPNQIDLLGARLQWGTNIDGVYAIGDTWPLDTQAVGDSLESLSAEYAELHVIFLEETRGDPDGLIREWLDGHLTLVSQEWFGPVELLHYAGSDDM